MSKLYFGSMPNIKEGQVFESRKALIEAGLHRSIQHGIDGNGTEGVAAIVVSGGYEDDLDLGDEIIYTGHGGNDPKTKKQIDHQSWESHGNKGLKLSQKKKLPVRVIRGPHENSKFAPKKGYKYGGLYNVIESWDKIGKSGFKICLFRLKKIDFSFSEGVKKVKIGTLVQMKPNGLEPKWFSIGVDAPNAQKLNSTSAFAQAILDRNTGEMVEFGKGFKILEIKNFLNIE